MKKIVIKIHGQVQGVGFRYAATKKAAELGIHADPRNEPDGSVSVCAEGAEPALGKFIEWCRVGPPAAKIKKIEVEEN
ncbi:MAG: acylphosphatase [Patescibacteria group bacterium]|nr:acylphosphatase [Patescibacteria group bacterium]